MKDLEKSPNAGEFCGNEFNFDFNAGGFVNLNQTQLLLSRWLLQTLDNVQSKEQELKNDDGENFTSWPKPQRQNQI